jgi:hypothetical protein
VKRLTRHLPAPATIISITALLVALGGTGYSAVMLVPRNSVGSAQVINGSLQRVDLSKGVTSALKGGRGVPGPGGPAGTAGPAGPAGATGLAGATGPGGAPGATGSAGATGAVGATGPTGLQGDPSTAGRVATYIGPLNGPTSNGPSVVDLGSVTITVPSDANFVHVFADSSFAGSSGLVTMYEFIAENNCTTVNAATQEFETLLSASDQISMATQGVFSATTGSHTYHLCWLPSASSASYQVHMTAVTEALNGTGGTTGPALTRSPRPRGETKLVSGD